MEADCSILQEVSSMLQMGFPKHWQRTQILEELHKMLKCKQPSLAGGEHENNGVKMVESEEMMLGPPG
jgi:hypothetical protein